MTFTLTFAWWWIPTAITLLCFLAVHWYSRDDNSGMFSGIATMIFMVPALFVSMRAWIIAAIFK